MEETTNSLSESLGSTDQQLDDRKKAILHSIVSEHIETAQPVGSAHVLQSSGLKVSPATIRNEMAHLEEEGYLVQPHTSAGRIPTDKGYRFFVDHLDSPQRVGQESMEEVRSFFERTHGELEEMFKETSRMLSTLTHYAALVMVPAKTSCVVKSIQLVQIMERVAILIVVLSDGSIEKHTLTLGEIVDDNEISEANTILRRVFCGLRRGDTSVAEPVGTRKIDNIVRQVHAIMSNPQVDSTGESLFVQGASRMAEAFDAVETVRSVLTILEQQILVVNLIRSVIEQDKLTVAIGQEHGVALLAQCSVVVAPYRVGTEEKGIVGVLGPTRMDYQNAMAAVLAVGDELEARLS